MNCIILVRCLLSVFNCKSDAVGSNFCIFSPQIYTEFHWILFTSNLAIAKKLNIWCFFVFFRGEFTHCFFVRHFHSPFGIPTSKCFSPRPLSASHVPDPVPSLHSPTQSIAGWYHIKDSENNQIASGFPAMSYDFIRIQAQIVLVAHRQSPGHQHP